MAASKKIICIWLNLAVRKSFSTFFFLTSNLIAQFSQQPFFFFVAAAIQTSPNSPHGEWRIHQKRALLGRKYPTFSLCGMEGLYSPPIIDRSPFGQAVEVLESTGIKKRSRNIVYSTQALKWRKRGPGGRLGGGSTKPRSQQYDLDARDEGILGQIELGYGQKRSLRN